MSARWGRVVTPHGSRALDVLVVAGLAATDGVGLAVDASSGRLQGAGRITWLTVVATAVATAFLWRRRRPLVVVAASVVGVVAAGAAYERALVSQRAGVQLVLLAYAVASWSARHRRIGAALAIGIGVLAAVGVANDGGGPVQVATLPLALVGAPWFAGVAARQRRRHLAGVEERLARAEADREERARRAVAGERARIARELHDVVAHHVSLIGVQAGAARTTLAAGDDGTRRSLAGIEASSRDAVREMRRLLEVLDEGDTPLEAPHGLADVRALAAGYAAAVSDGVAMTVYRVVEEALTNVTRHSQARACRVTVVVEPAAVRLTVADPGPSQPRAPVPPPGAGRGLVGMRERVQLFGGSLAVGPTPDGGYLVDAVVPVAP